MKKVIIVMLIALIIPACIFAGRGLFDLTLGAAASTTYTPKMIKEGALENFKFGDITWGLDTEIKIAFAAVDAKVMYAPEAKAIYGNVSANLALDIFFVRVKAGLGYEYTYDIDDKTMWYGNCNNAVTSFDDFKDAAFDINVGVDFLLGDLTIGAYANLPTSTTIANGDWAGVFNNAKEHWEDAQIGLVVGIALL
ncbi:MAG: hypothetical protein J5775_04975 [Spirochaetales bacterium]|nr:hypothetical protein [Spirochaetales bacterium]